MCWVGQTPIMAPTTANTPSTIGGPLWCIYSGLYYCEVFYYFGGPFSLYFIFLGFRWMAAPPLVFLFDTYILGYGGLSLPVGLKER